MTNDVIRRLLGPEGKPLSCEECFAELDRYVERTLVALELGDVFDACSFCNQADTCARERDCLGMRSHLESCSACDEEYASLRDFVAAKRTS